MAAEPGRREHAAVNRFLKRQLQEPLDQRLDVTAQTQRAEIATEALREVKTKSLVLDNARRERSKQVVKEAAERKILTRLHRARQPHARRRKALSIALQACSRDEDFEGLRQAWVSSAASVHSSIAKTLSGAKGDSDDPMISSSQAKEEVNLATSKRDDGKPVRANDALSWKDLVAREQSIRTILKRVGLLGAKLSIHIKAGGNLAKPLRGTVIYVSEDVFYLLRSGRSGRVHRIPLRKTQAQFQAPLDRLGVFWTDAAQLVKAEL